MSTRLVVACLARNEADRYLRAALEAWCRFADKIVLLDDNSEDKTAKIACSYDKVALYVRYGELPNAWGAEAAARRELWDAVREETAPGDVVLWLDADMVPLDDPREMLTPVHDGYAFALYDLWGEDAGGRLLYRDDALWCAHYRPRVWAVKMPPKSFRAEWPERGIHCGHLPQNLALSRVIFAPLSHALLHYGYYDESDRLAKAAAYLALDELTDAEREHARSIVDYDPRLKLLLEKTRWRLTKKRSAAASASGSRR